MSSANKTTWAAALRNEADPARRARLLSAQAERCRFWASVLMRSDPAHGHAALALNMSAAYLDVIADELDEPEEGLM